MENRMLSVILFDRFDSVQFSRECEYVLTLVCVFRREKKGISFILYFFFGEVSHKQHQPNRNNSSVVFFDKCFLVEPIRLIFINAPNYHWYPNNKERFENGNCVIRRSMCDSLLLELADYYFSIRQSHF